jgi:hypothetical protein
MKLYQTQKKRRKETIHMKNKFSILLVIAAVIAGFTTIFGQDAPGKTCPYNTPEVRAQRAAFAQLEPAERAAIWKEHLTKQLATRSLTQEQRRLIIEARELVTKDRSIDFKRGNY